MKLSGRWPTFSLYAHEIYRPAGPLLRVSIRKIELKMGVNCENMGTVVSLIFIQEVFHAIHSGDDY